MTTLMDLHQPVGDWPLPDLDGAQLLDAALQTQRHVGVGDVEGLPYLVTTTEEAMR